MATSATPAGIIQADIAGDCKVIPTGEKYGTMTLIHDGMRVEVTTYRADGTYSDGRRPDNVTFSDNIVDDLSRRDFTMNAVACDLFGNLVDPFNGVQDIHDGIIRAAGDPSQRFQEDALRVADHSAGKTPGDIRYLDEIRQVAKELTEAGVSNPSKALAVNGHDIMKALGTGPGEMVGKILRELREHIIDYPEDNTKDALLTIARGIL